jgi:hypothetical protein
LELPPALDEFRWTFLCSVVAIINDDITPDCSLVLMKTCTHLYYLYHSLRHLYCYQSLTPLLRGPSDISTATSLLHLSSGDPQTIHNVDIALT